MTDLQYLLWRSCTTFRQYLP